MVTIFKLDIEGLVDFPSPIVVIKEISSNLKTFQVDEIEFEDITRKMRKVLVCSGIPPKAGLRSDKVLARFHVHSNLTWLKEKFPEGKLLGQAKLVSDVPLFVYREEKA